MKTSNPTSRVGSETNKDAVEKSEMSNASSSPSVTGSLLPSATSSLLPSKSPKAMKTSNPTSRVVSESNKDSVEKSEMSYVLFAVVGGVMAVAVAVFLRRV